MRINKNSIIPSLGALVLAFGLTACLEADEASAPEVQADAQEEVQAAPDQAAQAQPQGEAPKAVVPEQAKEQAPKAQPKADKAQEAPKSENKQDVEELIEPEVKASIPDVITQDDDTRLQAQYEQTISACTEIRTVCMDDGNEEAKCVKIEQGCMKAAESLRSGATTRAGLLSVLKSLVEGVLGVGDAAVSLVRCVSRLIGCAFTTLSLHCAADLVECVVEDVIAK